MTNHTNPLPAETFSVKEAARVARHLSEYQIRKRCEAGLIDYGIDQGRWFVDAPSLRAYLKSCKIQGGAA